MKKIKIIFLSMLFIFVFSFGLAGCNSSSNSGSFETGSNELTEENDSLFNIQAYQIYKLAADSGFTGTYEEWLASIRGDVIVLKIDSDNNLLWKYSAEDDFRYRVLFNFNTLKGKDGEKGEDGHTPVITIGDNGNWFVDNVDTKVKAQGEQGETGAQGKSAYDIFKENYPHYDGDEKEWVTDIAQGNIEKLFNENHEFDEGVITQEAKAYVDGYKTYTCKVCGFTYEEIIPQLIPADCEVYTIDGIDYINFGKYPQKHVNDEDIISHLDLIESTNENGYYEYNGNEYAKIVKTTCSESYVDNYGNTQFYKYSDGNNIKNGTCEYFLVEPIKWIITETTDGNYTLLSEKILDQQEYSSSEYDRLIGGVTIHANNYEYSTVREFLNSIFLNNAFSSSQISSILITNVDNSYSSSNDTKDRIFLATYVDEKYRVASVTDYAIAKGVYISNGKGHWWTRVKNSLNNTDSINVYTDKGSINRTSGPYYSYDGNHVSNLNHIGVRPVTIIVLGNDE